MMIYTTTSEESGLFGRRSFEITSTITYSKFKEKQFALRLPVPKQNLCVTIFWKSGLNVFIIPSGTFPPYIRHHKSRKHNI